MVSVGERLGLIPAADPDIAELPEGLQVTRTSIFTRKRNTMVLPIQAADYIRWRDTNALVQDVFPELSADQREFLMSGATPEEWAGVFGKDEGDD